MIKTPINWDDFEKLDIRVGTIIEVRDFEKARNPSYQITVDFGPLGIKKSSAQITALYSKEELLDQQIIAIVNFPAKQIANFISECLILGIYGNDPKEVTLISPNLKVENGLKIG